MSKHAIKTPYEDLLREIMEDGVQKGDRTGTGTLSLPFRQLRFNLQQGFPLITTKKVWTKGIIHELLWFLKGDTNIKYLQDNDVHIWDEWADDKGELGPVYGSQWRHWSAERVPGTKLIAGGTDQITALIDGLRRDPEGRRHIVTAWNPSDLDKQNLPPCHMLFQMYVADGQISCQLTQRSADMFLGVPFNIASYALLTHMVAQQTGLGVGEFVWNGGDCHIYLNHRAQVHEQLTREPRAYPTLALRERPSIFDYKYEDVEILNYNPHPVIRGEVAV